MQYSINLKTFTFSVSVFKGAFEPVSFTSSLFVCSLKTRLVEPSQIVLSQVQSLTKAESFLRPLEAGKNSGYVAM